MSYRIEKQATYNRDGWKCKHCKIRHGLTPHHVQFRSHGGPDIRQNLLTLCFQCHDAVHDCKLVIFVVRAFTEIEMTGSNFENVDLASVRVRFLRTQGWKPK